MCKVNGVVVCACVAAAALVVAGPALAAPITVQSYAYTSALVPSGSYPDNGSAPGTGMPNTELIDGLYPTIGVGTAFGDARWIGVSNSTDNGQPHPEITFNLGSKFDISSFTVVYDVDHGPVIYAPDSVSVSVSDDNVTYSTPLPLIGFDDSGSAQITRATTFNLPFTSGQFVKLAFFNDQEWTFLAEISFDGQMHQPIPEPSSLALFGLGLVGMMQTARRRK